MVKSVTEFIEAIKRDLGRWESGTKPWFRGESGGGKALSPRIANFNAGRENYVLQSFRRQAGGLANVPDRDRTDEWLFLAQHYGVPTRLLDWTEGALLGLYFAINRDRPKPTVFMLNPRKLNDTAGARTSDLNYPLSWIKPGGGLYVALAWQNRTLSNKDRAKAASSHLNLQIPLAFPATYQDQRMIAQRSCFTIHGTVLEPIEDILRSNNLRISDFLFKYSIDRKQRVKLLKKLSILGVSGATIFPDLDHLATDLSSEIES